MEKILRVGALLFLVGCGPYEDTDRTLCALEDLCYALNSHQHTTRFVMEPLAPFDGDTERWGGWPPNGPQSWPWLGALGHKGLPGEQPCETVARRTMWISGQRNVQEPVERKTACLALGHEATEVSVEILWQTTWTPFSFNPQGH